VTEPRVVAIMQPTYLPWIGYLAMIDRVDMFVYLDTVQFARRSWQHRNRIKSAHGELLLSIPTFNKGRRDQKIADVCIDWTTNFSDSHWRSIEMAYRKAKEFRRYAEELHALLTRREERLADYTIALSGWLCQKFGIETPVMRSSAIEYDGAKADALAAICQSCGADRYLSAPGSQEYIEESDAFARAGVDVEYHRYRHPRYEQGAGEFLEYMSSIDLLFHHGGEAGLAILKSGVVPERADA